MYDQNLVHIFQISLFDSIRILALIRLDFIKLLYNELLAARAGDWENRKKYVCVWDKILPHYREMRIHEPRRDLDA